MSEEINNNFIVIPIENVYTVEETIPFETRVLYEHNNTETIPRNSKKWSDYIYIILCFCSHIPFIFCNSLYLIENNSCISKNVSELIYYFVILNTFIESFSLLFDLKVLYFIDFTSIINVQKHIFRFLIFHFIINLINVIIYSIVYYILYKNMTLDRCSVSKKSYINVLLTYNIICGIIYCCSIVNSSN